ncbi:MAG: LacI family DNA-binding transcriptional regulator [Bacteroidia bacterium]
MKKIDLDKVAKALGVSKTLVSLVLNDKGAKYGISEKTQKEVIKKAKELNYKPNLIARGLRTGRSNIIGLVVADISNPFYARISRSIEKMASKNGYNLIICSSEENEEKEEQLIDILVRGQNADGVIVSSTQKNSAYFSKLQKENTPFVLIDRYIPRLNANYVTVDNFNGAFAITEHLIRLGYKKIGMLTISPHFISTISDRVKGYKAALKKNNVPFNKKIVREIPFATAYESVDKEIRELTGKGGVDALFVVNNNLAVYCLEVLNKIGLRIPQDVALTCFDDLEMFKFCDPSITAVAQPVEDIGHNAFELLLNQMKAKEKASVKQIVLPTELIIRRSCGKYLRGS